MLSRMVVWAQSPEAGPILHLAASLLAALVSAGVGYATDNSNPLHLDVPTLGLVGTLGNAAVSWLRQYGKISTTADQIIPNQDAVIVPTAGRKPPPQQPPPQDPPTPDTDPWANFRDSYR